MRATLLTLCLSGLAAQILDTNQGARYRFVFTRVDGRYRSDSVALGEVELLGAGGGNLLILRVTNPGGEQRVTQNAERAIDGSAVTKWIDTNFELPAPGLLEGNTSILQFTLADPAGEVDGYRFYTANDAPLRDPVSWRFEKRASGADTWHVLHAIDGFHPPISRSTSYLPGSEAFWITAPPPAPPRPEYRLLVTATRDLPRRSDSVSLGEVVLWTSHLLLAPIHSTTNPGGEHQFGCSRAVTRGVAGVGDVMAPRCVPSATCSLCSLEPRPTPCAFAGTHPWNQGPSSATDRVRHTKWLDLTFVNTRRSELIFTLAADVTVHAYELVTGDATTMTTQSNVGGCGGISSRGHSQSPERHDVARHETARIPCLGSQRSRRRRARPNLVVLRRAAHRWELAGSLDRPRVPAAVRANDGLWATLRHPRMAPPCAAHPALALAAAGASSR